jgi:hypothetical protein
MKDPRLRLSRNIVVAWRRGPRFWGDVITSVWELMVANRVLRSTPSAKLPLLCRPKATRNWQSLTVEQEKLLDRVAYTIPAIAMRVPWRSDCLVQALAARRWLSRAGIPSDVCLGVRKDEPDFRAHAWLKVHERVVTGGDISGYAELPPAKINRSPSGH